MIQRLLVLRCEVQTLEIFRLHSFKQSVLSRSCESLSHFNFHCALRASSSRKIIDHIERELFERGVSGSLSNQLVDMGEALAVESSTIEVQDSSPEAIRQLPASPSTPAPAPYTLPSSSLGSQQRRDETSLAVTSGSRGAMQLGTSWSCRDAHTDSEVEEEPPSPASTSTTPPPSTSKSEPETPQAQRSDLGAEQSSPSESPSVLDAAIIAFREERNRLASARKFNKQKKFIQDREAILSLAERRKQYADFLSKKTEKARLKAQKQAKRAAKSKAKSGCVEDSPVKQNPWKGGGIAKSSTKKKDEENLSPPMPKSHPKANKAKAVSPKKPTVLHQQKANASTTRRKVPTSTPIPSNNVTTSRHTNEKRVPDSGEEEEKERTGIQVLKGKSAQKHNLASNSKNSSSRSTLSEQEKNETNIETESIDLDSMKRSMPFDEEAEQSTSLIEYGSDSTKKEMEISSREEGDSQKSDTYPDKPRMQEKTQNSKDQNDRISIEKEEAFPESDQIEQPEYHESASEADKSFEGAGDENQIPKQDKADSDNSERQYSASNSPKQAETESTKQRSTADNCDGSPDVGVEVNGVDDGTNAVNADANNEIATPQSSIQEEQLADACKEASAVETKERPVEGVPCRVEVETHTDDVVTNELKVDEAADGVSVDMSEGMNDLVSVNIHATLPRAKRTLEFEANKKGVAENDEAVDEIICKEDAQAAERIGEDAVVIDVPGGKENTGEAEISTPQPAAREEECVEVSTDEKREDKEEEGSDLSSDYDTYSSTSSPLYDDLHNHSTDQRDELQFPGKPHVETIMHPYAGAARSLTIREIPNLETNNPLSEWIRPSSAHSGLSAWGGTPSPPSSPTYMSSSSKFDESGAADFEWTPRFPDIGPIESKKARAPIVSPKKQVVNYAAIYEKIEEIFVRFIGEEKLSEGRPFSGRKRPTSAKLSKKATAKYTDQDILDFLEKYKGSLYGWLKTFHINFNKVLEEREEEEEVEAEGSAQNNSIHMVYKVTDDKPEVYKLVTASFHSIGDWHEDVSAEEVNPQWNILWSWSSKPKVNRQSLNIWQRINHYPGANQLTRKDTLKKNLQYCKSLFKHNKSVYKLFDIMPLTFSLPNEYVQFCNAFSENITFEKQDPNEKGGKKRKPKIIYGSENTWIMKPVSSSRGRGIFLINSIEEVEYGEAFVIQKYVSNPLLIHNHKFDLRLYVLVTCFNPLEAWLYKEGFARFCSVPYSSDKGNLHDKYIHLTNSSVQQALFKDPDFSLPECLRPMISDNPLLSLPGGSKRSLKYLQDKFEDYDINWDAIWQKIRSAVLAALFSAQKKIPFQPNSFELFGFDVMIDSNLKVWLLEVNASPSLGIQTELDQHLKKELICDVLKLVDPAPYDRSALLDVVQKKICHVSAPRSSRSTNVAGKAHSSSHSTDQKILQADLHSILRGVRPRQYGELPKHQGNFERIAPSQSYNQFDRLFRKPA